MPLSIVLIGSDSLFETFQTALAPTYAVHRAEEMRAYMDTLMAEQPVLVVVDGRLDDWARWTSTPKSSPATRRIPIVLLSDDAAQRERAAKQGADAAVPLMDADPQALISTYARLPNAEIQAQLESACEGELPELAQQAIVRFNSGEYYKQHDLLEELWMQTPGPERDLYQGILQVGVAYYQIGRSNPRGARKMLQRALQWLRKLPPTCQGVDVEDLRQNAQKVLDILSEEGFRIEEFDAKILKPVRYNATYKKEGVNED
jgi:uncharacterized protein